MPKYIKTDYGQNILIPVNLSKQLEPGTLEYAIDNIVETKIDIKPFEDKIINDETGRPAWNPKVLLKIILLSYSRGIFSSRRIKKACEENIIFIAISGNSIPDHTVIADFIKGMEDKIAEIFVTVLLICDELKLLGETIFALDGCKISSNASKEWSGTKKELENKAKKLEVKIKELLKKHKDNDSKNDKEECPDEYKKREKRAIKKLRSKVKKIKRFIEQNKSKEGKRGKELKSNITDNDSAKIKTEHGVVQGYNGQAMVDEKHQIIVAADVFGTGPENDLFIPMIHTANKNMKDIGKGKRYLSGKKVLSDTGYFSEDNLAVAEKEGIDVYIPDQQFRKRDIRFENADKYKPKKKEKFKLEDFIYDKKKDKYICPDKKILSLDNRNLKMKHYSGRKYKARQADCSKCGLREKCLRGPKTKRRHLLIINKKYNKSYTGEMIKKIDTSAGRAIYSKRMGIVEPVFANIRNNKKLNYFTLRGKKKVNIQWLLYCIVHNIEKAVNYGNYGLQKV